MPQDCHCDGPLDEQASDRQRSDGNFCVIVGVTDRRCLPSQVVGGVPLKTNTVEKSVLLPYPASAVFALIERIEDYPGFLPWCGGTEVDRPAEGPIQATVSIAFKGLKQKFTTRNRHHAPADGKPGTITMELLDGPFTHLDGDWQGEPACKVSFRLDYQMRSGLLGMALSPVFGQIASTFIDAFVREADRRYG